MARFLIVGVKRFYGRVDGNNIDSGKLYVECKLDDSRNSSDQFSKGVFTEELRLPSSELVKRIEHLPLPFYADIDTERVGNGKLSKEIVLDVRPVQQAPQSARAAGSSVMPVKAAA